MMARPIKEGLDYFPLDCDIDQDDKISMIEALHGVEGFGVVIKLFMKIYKEGYFYEWTKREQILFSKRVNVDINSLEQIVNDCMNEGIFNKDVHEKHGVLTSKGIQKRYLEAVKRRKEVTFRKDIFLVKDVKSIIGESKIHINFINVDINSDDADISTQRKGKERKGEDIKVVEDQPQQNIIEFFESSICRLSPNQIQNLYQWQDDFKGQADIIIEAITIADNTNKRTFNFVQYLLREWSNNKLESLDRVRAYESEKFNKTKGNTGQNQKQNGRRKEGSYEVDYSEYDFKKPVNEDDLPF